MNLTRLKNWKLFLLLYSCSMYHIGCSLIVMLNGEDRLLSSYNSDGYQLKVSMLPVYGFETFLVMTMIFLLDYFFVRFSFFAKINVRQFLRAFLYSQWAYVVYIYHLVWRMLGIPAVVDGMLSFFVDLPTLVISFLVSKKLFNDRLEQIRAEEMDNASDTEGYKREVKQLIVDYLLFTGMALILALGAYWLTRH